jgi:hypothetical protein
MENYRQATNHGGVIISLMALSSAQKPQITTTKNELVSEQP